MCFREAERFGQSWVKTQKGKKERCLTVNYQSPDKSDYTLRLVETERKIFIWGGGLSKKASNLATYFYYGETGRKEKLKQSTENCQYLITKPGSLKYVH